MGLPRFGFEQLAWFANIATVKPWRITTILLVLLLGIDALAITCAPKTAVPGFFGVSVSRARYYNPQVGRFWTMDTFEGNQTDPLSLHKYLYCHADPVNKADPTGLVPNMYSIPPGAHEICVVTDKTSDGDLNGWRVFGYFYGEVYGPISSTEQLIDILKKRVEKYGAKLDTLNLSGHGIGAGVAYKEGGFHVDLITERQASQIRALFREGGTVKLWGCSTADMGQNEKDMQALANKLQLRVIGSTQPVAAGPDGYPLYNFLTDLMVRIATGEKTPKRWRTFTPGKNSPHTGALLGFGVL